MDDDSLHFDDGPQLELDQLLIQLISRARDVQNVQSRLRGLLAANEAIMGNLELPVVLRQIVRAACELVHARYGALGVIGPEGGLEQFLHYGIDDATVAEIGNLPQGRGLLGALIDDPLPIRLRQLSDDPRSVGFPEHHPPMTSFVGVPIRVRESVFGNLYLTEREDGDFSAEDEELISAIAGTAAIAIENARLYDEARKRQRWLAASAEITQQLLAESGEDPLSLIARSAQEMSDADVVTVVLPAAVPGMLMVDVATGLGADELTKLSYPVEKSVAGAAILTGEPILVDDLAAQDTYVLHMADIVPVGAVMSLPLIGSTQARGALLIGRLTGRRGFTANDLEMATTFANHAAVALELADARADQQRVALLEDRDRIARDLHDHVIQRLFAAGLTVQSVQSAVDSPEAPARLSRVVTDLDDTIRQIRTSIFALRGTLSPAAPKIRADLLDIVGEHAAQLGFEPALQFAGPVDSVVPAEVAADLAAVLREGLSNIARHAHATAASVTLSVGSDELALDITDDGVGLGDTSRRSGLENLRQRAVRHGGSLTVTSIPRKGTHLKWQMPLT